MAIDQVFASRKWGWREEEVIRVRGQDEVRDREELATRMRSLPLTRMQPSLKYGFLDPGNNAAAGSLRTCPLPVSSPSSPRYLWSVNRRNISWLTLLGHWPCFSVAWQKFKKPLVISSRLLARFYSSWVVFPQSGLKAGRELNVLFLASRQKPPSFSRSVYLSCDSGELGLWIWISIGSGVLAAVAGPRPWQHCWINFLTNGCF